MPEHEIRILKKDVAFRVKEEDGQRKLEGYAAKFNRVAEIGWWFDEEIAPGAFSDAIKEDDVRALINHDANLVLGRTRAKTLELKEDDMGLWFNDILPDTQVARDLVVSIERGDVSQMSFSFDIKEAKWKFAEKEGERDKRTLIKVKLYDVSVATYPAYEDTEVYARSKGAWEKDKELWVKRKKEQQDICLANTQYYKTIIDLL